LSEITHKADQCNRLVTDPYLKQAFKDVRDALHQRFEQASVSDGDTLLDIRKMLHLLDSVWANLERAVSDGKLEQYRMEQEAKGSFLGELNGNRETH